MDWIARQGTKQHDRIPMELVFFGIPLMQELKFSLCWKPTLAAVIL